MPGGDLLHGCGKFDINASHCVDVDGGASQAMPSKQRTADNDDDVAMSAYRELAGNLG